MALPENVLSRAPHTRASQRTRVAVRVYVGTNVCIYRGKISPHKRAPREQQRDRETLYLTVRLRLLYSSLDKPVSPPERGLITYLTRRRAHSRQESGHLFFPSSLTCTTQARTPTHRVRLSRVRSLGAEL